MTRIERIAAELLYRALTGAKGPSELLIEEIGEDAKAVAEHVQSALDLGLHAGGLNEAVAVVSRLREEGMARLPESGVRVRVRRKASRGPRRSTSG